MSDVPREFRFPEMSAAPSQLPAPDPVSTAAPRAPVAPNPPRQRLLLLLKLFLVPAALVCLPTLLVTYIFGQRPQPKTPPETAFTGLRESLERAARERLPEGETTFGARFEDLSLPYSPAEADARLETLRALAERWGGTLTDQAADPAGRHLLVDLPAANLPRFRQEVTGHATTAPAPEVTATPAAGDRIFLRVTLAPIPPPAP